MNHNTNSIKHHTKRKEAVDSFYIKMMKTNREMNNEDEDRGHSTADDLLCNFLEELGYKKLVDEYKKVKKWYA